MFLNDPKDPDAVRPRAPNFLCTSGLAVAGRERPFLLAVGVPRCSRLPLRARRGLPSGERAHPEALSSPSISFMIRFNRLPLRLWRGMAADCEGGPTTGRLVLQKTWLKAVAPPDDVSFRVFDHFSSQRLRKSQFPLDCPRVYPRVVVHCVPYCEKSPGRRKVKLTVTDNVAAVGITDCQHAKTIVARFPMIPGVSFLMCGTLTMVGSHLIQLNTSHQWTISPISGLCHQQHKRHVQERQLWPTSTPESAQDCLLRTCFAVLQMCFQDFL